MRLLNTMTTGSSGLNSPHAVDPVHTQPAFLSITVKSKKKMLQHRNLSLVMTPIKLGFFQQLQSVVDCEVWCGFVAIYLLHAKLLCILYKHRDPIMDHSEPVEQFNQWQFYIQPVIHTIITKTSVYTVTE